MAALPSIEDWVASANDALVVKLLAADDTGLQQVASFQPKFTYTIFGEEEQIFGYKNPKIELRYRANDMRPHVKFTYKQKMKPMGEAEPTNITHILEDGQHLPRIAFASEKDFEDSAFQMSNSWSPPGKLHSSYTTSDGTYEVWRGTLDDPAIRQILLRVQIFVTMFIDGGSYIGQKPESESPEQDLSDADRWTVFFLYRKAPASSNPKQQTYSFAGFSTVYRFYYFQPPTPPASPAHDWELPDGNMKLEQLPCRTRLSQFVIIPPFQGKGNGQCLYKSIFEHYLHHPQTRDFTIENPNEAFDDLRDVCDLAYLRTVPEFAALRLDTRVKVPKSGPIPQLVLGGDSIELIRQKTKIAPRQFSRVLEMYLMSQLPKSVRPKMPLIEEGVELPQDDDGPAPTRDEKHMEKLWELIVKQRLYRHNKDILSQIDVEERIDKLQETLGGVGLAYARLLALHDEAVKHSGTSSVTNGKRKMDADAGEGSSKRARTEEA